MSQTDARLGRLKEFLSRMKAGKDVARRDLRSVLADAEWIEFNAWWEEEKTGRPKSLPRELVEYN